MQHLILTIVVSLVLTGTQAVPPEREIKGRCHEMVSCEGETMEIACPAGSVMHIADANYGRTLPDAELCPYGKSHNDFTNCFARNSMSVVAKACEGQSSCKVASSNGAFGDPCYLTYKYLRVNYCCDLPRPNHCVERVACEPRGLTLECPGNSVIHVEEANYGRTVADAKLCPYGRRHRGVTTCYAANSMSLVTSQCEGKASCYVNSGNRVFGDPCGGTYKYLSVKYCCNPPGKA